MKTQLLVVDDEKDIREMLSRHFRYLGYDVKTAEDGRQALASLEESKIDVIISDIMMPQMDGIELLRQTRTQFPMVHTIMITGFVSLDNALACMRLGADTCVFKPLEDLAELESAVSHAVGQISRWVQKLQELRAMKQESIGAARE